MKTITLTEDAIGSILNSLDASGAQEQANCLREAVSASDPHDDARVRLLKWVHAKEGRMIVCLDVNLQALEDYNDEIACELNPTALWLAIQEREGREGKK